MLRAVNREPASPYDRRSYQRITDAAYADGKLRVVFENGDAAAIDASVFEQQFGPVDWEGFGWNEYELTVPVDGIGDASIPWIDLRRQQDPAFARYLDELAGEQAARTGTKLRLGREQKGLSVAGLAELAGLEPERVDLIERGHDYTLPELLALAETLELSLIDLVAVDV